MEQVIQERTCRDCGGALGAGREDRLYCSDACRTNYNNKKKRRDRQPDEQQLEVVHNQLSVPEYIERIQEIILSNRGLLESLCDEENAGHIRMRNLIGRGFNPKFFTSETEPTGTGNVYRFCFEYGYREDENGMAVVICRKREVY